MQLIKALLNKEFYDKYKHRLTKDFFLTDNNARAIFSTIEKAYETVTGDLTVDSLKGLHYAYNPAITASNKAVVEGLFTDLAKLDVSKESSEVVLKQAIEQQLWNELSNLAMSGTDGFGGDITRAQEIVDIIKEGISIDDVIEYVTTDFDELLEDDEEQKWKFHLNSLREVLDGVGPGTFTLIAGRPNSGKTCLAVSFVFQPEGFLDQGAKVHYIGNEEKAKRTQRRGLLCFTGHEKQKFITDYEIRKKAKEEWDNSKVKNNIYTRDLATYSAEDLQKYVADNRDNMDILVIDQIDKLTIRGDYSNEADRIRKLYILMREIAKKYDIAVIGVCQASADAENRTHWGFECLENSKTGKAAEVDVCMCIGFRRDSDGRDTGYRTLNLAKNKLSGREEHITYGVDFPTSRVRA